MVAIGNTAPDLLHPVMLGNLGIFTGFLTT